MAYANLFNLTCSDKNEFFCRMRDFICKRNGTYDYSTTGIGWTLHDSSYATDEDNVAINDWYVIYSPGENGDEDMYFKVTWVSSFIKIQGYPSWNATTHAGGGTVYNAANNFTLPETGTYKLSIYGDLDCVMSINDILSSGCYGTTFGKFLPVYDDQGTAIATCSPALTAGSDVSIVLDVIPANWAVGKEVFIRTTHNNDVSTVKLEKITIKTLVSLTITADLANSYTANSKVSDFVGYFCCNGNQMANTGVVIINGAGTLAYAFLAPVTLGLVSTSHDPDLYESRFFLTGFYYAGTAGSVGLHPHMRKIPSFTTGFAIGDVLVDGEGAEWRCLTSYSNRPVAVKEV